METRSNNILVGVVTLLLLAAVAVFLVWLSRAGEGDQKSYDIFFKQSVSGLAKGSGVAFAGVPVGTVDEIKLWKNDPEFVRVRIRVDDEVPILQGTVATISGVGFTGVSEIQLDGAVKGAPPIVEAGPEGAPVIPTKPGALGELLNNAPLLIERLSTLTERLTNILSDKNQESIERILTNVEKTTRALGDSGPQIQATLAETRIAVARAGVAAEQLGQLAGTTNAFLDQEGRPLAQDLKRTVAAAQKSMEALEAATRDARPALSTLSTQTLPEANLLIRDLREMAKSLRAVSDRLDQQGAGGLVGSPALPDYKGK